MALMSFLAFSAQGQAESGNPASRLGLRVAIIIEEPTFSKAADLLTVELAQTPTIQLLERTEIDKVYAEQAMSSANRNLLKLGQVLGADGLLVLTKISEGQKQFLQARLVAVKPGVVTSSIKASWPIANPPQWAAITAHDFEPFFPKLAVQAKDAVPISVLNLRSAVKSSAGEQQERQLTLLTIERLSREPNLFILERQRMETLALEQGLNGFDESSFWKGKYLLDGVLDQTAVSTETLTLNLRLIPANGGPPVEFNVEGARTNLSSVADLVADKVRMALRLESRGFSWNAQAEADKYFEEAKWALGWGVLEQARAASETSWALGKRSRELHLLRIRSYSAQPWGHGWHMHPIELNNPWNLVYDSPNMLPNSSDLELAIRALELFSEHPSVERVSSKNPDTELCDLGLQLVDQSTAVLQDFYRIADFRQGQELRLAKLRTATCSVVSWLETNCPPTRGIRCTETPDMPKGPSGCLTLKQLAWEEGGFWVERPEDALPRLKRSLQQGFRPDTLPSLIGWTWNDRKRVPGILKQFIGTLCQSSDIDLKLEGLFLAVLAAPNDERGTLENSEQDLAGALWEARANRTDDMVDFVHRTENALRQKYDVRNSDLTFEPFATFEKRLRDDSAPNSPLRQLLSSIKPFDLPRRGEVEQLRNEKDYQVAVSANANPQIIEYTSCDVDAHWFSPHLLPEIRNALLHKTKVWLHVRYRDPNGNTAEPRTAFFGVDTETGSVQCVPFPVELGIADPAPSVIPPNPDGYYEVTDDSLIVSAQNKLAQYRFSDRTWHSHPLPTENGAKIAALNGKFFLTTLDSLLEVVPGHNNVRILASTRRQPPVNALDSLGHFGVAFQRSDGSVAVSAAGRFFALSDIDGSWKQVSDPPRLHRKPGQALHWWVNYGSDGHATLFRGGPGFSNRMQTPITFTKDGEPTNPNKLFDLGNPFVHSRVPIEFDTPTSLFIASPAQSGFWIIRKGALERRLQPVPEVQAGKAPSPESKTSSVP